MHTYIYTHTYIYARERESFLLEPSKEFYKYAAGTWDAYSSLDDWLLSL